MITFHFLIQARLGSTRFPGKVMELVDNETSLIEQVIRRVRQSGTGRKSELTVLTTSAASDDALVAFLRERTIAVARGDEHNVYERFRSFAEGLQPGPDYVVRVCADNPFLEPLFIDSLAEYTQSLARTAAPDYVSYRSPDGRPAVLTHWGFFVEFIRTQALLDAVTHIHTAAQREHVTPVFYTGSEFQSAYLRMPSDLPHEELRFTVDTPEDLATVRTLLHKLGDPLFTYRDVCDLALADAAIVGTMATGIATNAKRIRT